MNRRRNSATDVVELSEVLENQYDTGNGALNVSNRQGEMVARTPQTNDSAGIVYSNASQPNGAFLPPQANWDTEIDSDDEEEEERREKIHFYSNLFTIMGIIVGAAVILLVVALLTGLINWLRYDILHSAFLLQNGL